MIHSHHNLHPSQINVSQPPPQHMQPQNIQNHPNQRWVISLNACWQKSEVNLFAVPCDVASFSFLSPRNATDCARIQMKNQNIPDHVRGSQRRKRSPWKMKPVESNFILFINWFCGTVQGAHFRHRFLTQLCEPSSHMMQQTLYVCSLFKTKKNFMPSRLDSVRNSLSA